MKNSYTSISERRREIVRFIREHGEANVEILVKAFDTSPATIRRDLVNLNKMGMIHREFGKVKAVQTSPEDYNNDKNQKIEDIKNELAKIAANFIEEDSTIFINSSSAAGKVAKYLKNKRVNIVTNNIKVAFKEHHPQSTIVLTGGEVRLPKEALIGSYTVDFIDKIKSDIAVIGCYGLSIENGLTTPILAEAKINNLMVKNATKKVIAIADYRKLGNVANFKSAEATEVDYLITDSFADRKIIADLEKIGVTVIQINI
ncbi:DeoR/GlpR family DNA-binding transcription regulator [Floricoccus penangensis]|uniref:DeoR/GlpR family DNA-binding transcription regulator n=1 Tax=Floricoccus penangensis TaxID=1859475 RepID=UPI00204161D4|nr:DeoR/GlpR family DNA-binding transcription regulator [Floricoccus penangensis]URZ86853.1 DeoR/GlpR family DNA-binding transcription regulator [Floricoccus penangensis]